NEPLSGAGRMHSLHYFHIRIRERLAQIIRNFRRYLVRIGGTDCLLMRIVQVKDTVGPAICWAVVPFQLYVAIRNRRQRNEGTSLKESWTPKATNQHKQDPDRVDCSVV